MTQDELKKIIHYDPFTGILTRISGKMCGEITRLDGDGYIHTCINGKEYKAHHLAWLYMTGSLPTHEIDHKDHVRHNNAWSNLRETTHINNQRNKSMHRNNTSGVNGVSWCKRSKKWRATIMLSGKTKHLGYFIDKGDATSARDLANKEHNFHENHGQKSKFNYPTRKS